MEQGSMMSYLTFSITDKTPQRPTENQCRRGPCDRLVAPQGKTVLGKNSDFHFPFLPKHIDYATVVSIHLTILIN